ncbi:MAG: HepT-like ribonuclease domain-containing protein [Syntrophorhabdales bacterium]
MPTSFRRKHPSIPWSKMSGMRDILIHDYMGVDLKTVWKVVQERLPELKVLLLGLKSAKQD